jgi:hypothetical protein
LQMGSPSTCSACCLDTPCSTLRSLPDVSKLAAWLRCVTMP